METKWLEDFISLAASGSFSRSARDRNITQSAFSRRIQSLELWLGVPLVDRSTYPTTLTTQGRRFHETAEETVRMLHASRAELQASLGPSPQTANFAALHTLSLTFFPGWFRRIENQVGPLGSRLLPDDFHSCLLAIVEGNYDFLLTFHHPSVPILLEPALFPHLVVGSDSLVGVASPACAGMEAGAGSLPLLAYAADSFLGRMTVFAQAQAGAPTVHITHTNENAMAEALKFMALAGHGLAWLPRSSVVGEIADGRLVVVGPEVALQTRLYRSARRTRGVVEAIWAAAQRIGGRSMQDAHDPF